MTCVRKHSVRQLSLSTRTQLLRAWRRYATHRQLTVKKSVDKAISQHDHTTEQAEVYSLVSTYTESFQFLLHHENNISTDSVHKIL